MSTPTLVPILIADDDADDREFAQEALRKSNLNNPLAFVHDGVELLEYLRSDDPDQPRPGLLLVDLNMPRMSGLEAIREIKQDPELRGIPTVVMTSSRQESDVVQGYDLGVNSYVVKPITLAALIEVLQDIGHYWFQVVELPST